MKSGMKKILVAEDDPALQELIAAKLELLGYQVTVAGDGEQALRKMAETIPDLVLLDIQMPILDGKAVVQRMRKDPRFAGIPVIALTAFAMRGDREKALEAGFDNY